MLFKNGINLYNQVQEYINSAQHLVIFCPYIKIDKLEELLSNSYNLSTIIVRWELGDLVQGASDLELYQFCKKRGITLFRNTRLHQKVYLDEGRNSCLLTTANISQRALSVDNSSSFYNYEVGTIVDELTFEDRLYLEQIVASSLLVDEYVVETFRKKIASIPKPPTLPIFDIPSSELITSKDFLLSSLPMSEDVRTLKFIYFERQYEPTIDHNCALHDLVLYKIPLGLSEENFHEVLTQNFFAHPFIKAFLQAVDEQGGEVYFGFIRKWLAQNCADVPTPRAWEVTHNIQILYRWITELSQGKYVVDVPGRHSERLKRNF